MSTVFRFWRFEFSCFYNKSLKQVQIVIGRRYFEGSQNFTKAFCVFRWGGKDVFVLGCKGSVQAFNKTRKTKS